MDPRLQKLADIAGGLRGSHGPVSVNAADFCFLVDAAIGAAPTPEAAPKPQRRKSRPASSSVETTEGGDATTITHDSIDALRTKANAAAAAEQLGVELDESSTLKEMKAVLHEALERAEDAE